MILVADENITLEVTGNGDVLEAKDGIFAIGSGGPYALGKPWFAQWCTTTVR